MEFSAALAGIPSIIFLCQRPKISVANFLSRDIEANFLLPLSIEASMQLSELAGRILNIHCPDRCTDHWTYLWGATFTCKQAYFAVQGALPKQIQFTWLWNTSCRGKHKFFFAYSSCTDSTQETYLRESISPCHLTTVFFARVM